MRYKTIDDLDARIERIIKRTVEAYYTDWKNYDRPKYMKFKGSNDRKDKKIILIARAYGTYIYTLDEIEHSAWAATVYDYFQTQERATYYEIDLEKLEIKKIDTATYKIKKAA